jgi:hypothetical protein
MDLTPEQALAELKRERYIGRFYILLSKHGLRKRVVRYEAHFPHICVDVFQLPGGSGLDLVEEVSNWRPRSGAPVPPPRAGDHPWRIHREDGDRIVWRRPAAACLTKAETTKLIRQYERLRVQAGLAPRRQVGEPPLSEM